MPGAGQHQGGPQAAGARVDEGAAQHRQVLARVVAAEIEKIRLRDAEALGQSGDHGR